MLSTQAAFGKTPCFRTKCRCADLGGQPDPAACSSKSFSWSNSTRCKTFYQRAAICSCASLKLKWQTWRMSGSLPRTTSPAARKCTGWMGVCNNIEERILLRGAPLSGSPPKPPTSRTLQSSDRIENSERSDSDHPRCSACGRIHICAAGGDEANLNLNQARPATV